MTKKLIILLDPAHGKDVSGKCSPDGKHREYKWSRDRVTSLTKKLRLLGYDVYVTTDSENEPGLSVRRDFASTLRRGERKLLLSLHNNAAGDGRVWKDASGVEVFTSPGVTDSDICADYIIRQFQKDFPGVKFRLNEDKYLSRDKEASFTVLMGGGYMGVLIEWMFQDNKKDVEVLSNQTANNRFEESLVAAIEEINDHFDE